MPYGYLGQNTPNQTVSNSGVFSISDVADLEKQGKFGGSLEFIEEQTASSDSSVDFTTLYNYDVHLLQADNHQPSVQSHLTLRFSNNGGTSFISSGYQYALQYGGSTGTNGETRSTSVGYAGLVTSNSTTQPHSAYIYLYNLTNSSKYSFTTFHSVAEDSTGQFYYHFGGAVLPTAETHNAIRILNQTGTGTFSGTYKLYGVKQL